MIPLVDVISLSKQLCQHPIQGKLAYATEANVAAQVIDGYQAASSDLCLLTRKPAEALCEVQNFLNAEQGYGLFIYDAYRPKRAVRHFLRWVADSKITPAELERKRLQYPRMEKSQLFEQHYFDEDSNHCYGNTVDVVLRDLKSGVFLEMGSIYDFMDEESHLSTGPEVIGEEAYRHRSLLVEAMEKFGFQSYIKEYWHYAHGGVEGREVSAPLDVEITEALRGIGLSTP